MSFSDFPNIDGYLIQHPTLRLPGEAALAMVEATLAAQPGAVGSDTLANLFDAYGQNIAELGRWRGLVADRLGMLLAAADPATQQAAARRALARFYVWRACAPGMTGTLLEAAAQPAPPDAEAQAGRLRLLLDFLETSDTSALHAEQRARFALEALAKGPIDLFFPQLPALIAQWRGLWEAQRHPWLQTIMVAWIGRCTNGDAFVATLAAHLKQLHPTPRRAAWDFLGEMAAWFPASVPESARGASLLDRATWDIDLD